MYRQPRSSRVQLIEATVRTKLWSTVAFVTTAGKEMALADVASAVIAQTANAPAVVLFMIMSPFSSAVLFDGFFTLAGRRHLVETRIVLRARPNLLAAGTGA